MNVRTKLRTAAAAAAIAVMVLGSPAGSTLAAPKDTARASCKARGYIWDDMFGCADKKCSHNGGSYGAGDVIVVKGFTGRGKSVSVMYYCNGFTGQWVKV